MKKLITLLVVLLVSYSARSQCNATQNASLVISTSYSVNAFSDPAVIKVCSGGIAYDTVSGLNRTWYLENGGTLYLKSNPTTFVYMKSGSTLINKGSASAIIAYNESGSTIANTGNPPVNSVTCTTVTFPAAMSCTITGINENRSETAIVYPNPADERIFISGGLKLSKQELYDVLGKMVYSGNSNEIETAILPEGVYILKINYTDRSETSRRIVIKH